MKPLSFIRTFNELPLLPELLQALELHGYTKPMPVQSRGLQPLLQRKSTIVRARTGTGKTTLFSLPLLQAIQSGKASRALVLAPTRELAHQIFEEIKRLGEFCDNAKATCLVGGRSIGRQMAQLTASNILVMTPGRAAEALEKGHIAPGDIGVVVVDEADHMLETGSLDICERILETIVQKQTQLIFCSATFSDEIRRLCKRFRTNMLSIDVPTKIENTGEVYEWAINTYPENHLELTIEIFEQRKAENCIVFCNHRERVNEVAQGLQEAGLMAVPLHGELDQHERSKFMKKFRAGEVNILVATDLASRGIDIPGLELVINYDLPYEVTDYVHRFGRTGRAGKGGLVVNFYNGKAVRRIEDIEKRTGRNMQKTKHSVIMTGSKSGAKVTAGETKSRKLHIQKSMRLHMNRGRSNGMTSATLKHLLEKNCLLNLETEVAFMDVQERFTFVGVHPKKAQSVCETLNGMVIRGRELHVEIRGKSKPTGRPLNPGKSSSRGKQSGGKSKEFRKNHAGLPARGRKKTAKRVEESEPAPGERKPKPSNEKFSGKGRPSDQGKRGLGGRGRRHS